MLKLPKQKIIYLAIGTGVLILLALVATAVKQRSPSSPTSPTSINKPTTQPVSEFATPGTNQAGNTTPKTSADIITWSDPMLFTLKIPKSATATHKNEKTVVEEDNVNYTYSLTFCQDCTELKCDGLCNQKSTIEVVVGDNTISAKKAYPDSKNRFTIALNTLFPATTDNQPLYILATYKTDADFEVVKNILTSFTFTQNYKIPSKEAINAVKNLEEVRDLVTQYGQEISVVNLYEDIENKTWVVGVLRQPEDEAQTTIAQYAVNKFTGEVIQLF